MTSRSKCQTLDTDRGPVVFLDACVLFPSCLRDAVLRLAEAGVVGARWSGQVLEELERNLVKRLAGGPHVAPRVARLIDTLRTQFPRAEITDYELLIPAINNHLKDRHVLAAAVHAGVDALVTFNLKDFATSPIEILHPDAILFDLLDHSLEAILQVLRSQAAENRRPPRDLPSLLDLLERTGTPAFAEAVRRHLGLNSAHADTVVRPRHPSEEDAAGVRRWLAQSRPSSSG